MLFPRNRSEQYYRDLYETVDVIPEAKELLQISCNKIMLHKADYVKAVEGTVIPWEFPACLHMLEADCDMTRQFFNGYTIRLATRVWPNQNIGPWPDWQASAHAALHGEVKGFPNFAGMTDWDEYRILCRAECWNGTGYATMNKPSPYIWGMTNHGVGTGKYTADGKYNENATTNQIGIGALLKELRRRQAVAATAPPAQKPAARIVATVDLDKYAEVEKMIADLVAAFKGLKS